MLYKTQKLQEKPTKQLKTIIYSFIYYNYYLIKNGIYNINLNLRKIKNKIRFKNCVI